jgi:hypothetical protein
MSLSQPSRVIVVEPLEAPMTALRPGKAPQSEPPERAEPPAAPDPAAQPAAGR